jgi:hypothetical protein
MRTITNHRDAIIRAAAEALVGTFADAERAALARSSAAVVKIFSALEFHNRLALSLFLFLLAILHFLRCGRPFTTSPLSWRVKTLLVFRSSKISLLQGVYTYLSSLAFLTYYDEPSVLVGLDIDHHKLNRVQKFYNS